MPRVSPSTQIFTSVLKTLFISFPMLITLPHFPPSPSTGKALSTNDQCGSDCRSCSIIIGDIDCYDCVEGYKLIDFKCHKCALNGCGNCDEFINLCGYCKDGYYNNSKKGQGGFTYVSSCAPCVSGCNKCTNGKTCEKCFDNYNLNDELTCTLKNINLIRTLIFIGSILILFIIGYLLFKLQILALCFSSLKKKKKKE